jgi:AbrB family looped-hinge helix DNA binding protein
MAAQPNLVRVQEKGQVTLPAAIRKQLGIKKGDLVAVEVTPDGVLITPRAVLAIKALDEIGAILRDKGVTLEEWMESGREIREELAREQYGLDPTHRPD